MHTCHSRLRNVCLVVRYDFQRGTQHRRELWSVFSVIRYRSNKFELWKMAARRTESNRLLLHSPRPGIFPEYAFFLRQCELASVECHTVVLPIKKIINSILLTYSRNVTSVLHRCVNKFLINVTVGVFDTR